MTDTKVYTPDLGNTEMEFADHLTLPPVALEILQAIVRLMAFDKQNNTFRFLKTDELGNLRVTTSQPGLFLSNIGILAVTSSPTVWVAEQPSRRSILIRNTGSVKINFRFDTVINSGNGIPLEPGEALFDDLYTGAVTMWTDFAAGSANVQQLTTQFIT